VYVLGAELTFGPIGVGLHADLNVLVLITSTAVAVLTAEVGMHVLRDSRQCRALSSTTAISLTLERPEQYKLQSNGAPSSPAANLWSSTSTSSPSAIAQRVCVILP
jgi:hypothetical protein